MEELTRRSVKIAEISVVKILHNEYRNILSQRRYNVYMDVVATSLKECSHEPVETASTNGLKRLVRTVLLPHISDYSEQQLIAVTVRPKVARTSPPLASSFIARADRRYFRTH